MRRPPPPHPKGAPRTAGSGRKKGTPNRKTFELRQLMGALAGDVDYQERFSSAFRRRRLHPSTEMRVWDYVVGKPAERVQLSADVTMSQKLDQERELFSKLSLEQLEELAAESQALVDKARAMVRANGVTGDPATATLAPTDDGESIGEPADQSPGTDVEG